MIDATLKPTGRVWFALGCGAVLALSFVLDGDRPTGAVVLCPMRAQTGLPCPGCGVTRAVIAMSHGHVIGSLRHHPLGPAVWLAAVVGVSSLFWPAAWRRRLAVRWAVERQRVERTLYLGIAALTLFGVVRIVFHFTAPPAWWMW